MSGVEEESIGYCVYYVGEKLVLTHRESFLKEGMEKVVGAAKL